MSSSLKPPSSREWAQSRDGLTSKRSGPHAFGAPILFEPPLSNFSFWSRYRGGGGICVRSSKTWPATCVDSKPKRKKKKGSSTAWLLGTKARRVTGGPGALEIQFVTAWPGQLPCHSAYLPVPAAPWLAVQIAPARHGPGDDSPLLVARCHIKKLEHVQKYRRVHSPF